MWHLCPLTLICVGIKWKNGHLLSHEWKERANLCGLGIAPVCFFLMESLQRERQISFYVWMKASIHPALCLTVDTG